MDRHDADLIASAYHPDAVDDHGTFRGTVSQFIEHVNGDGNGSPGVHAENLLAHHHYVTNITIDLTGDVAHTETYYLFAGQRRDGSGTSLVFGRYIDRQERRDGRWAIAARRVILDWSGNLDGQSAMAADAFAQFTHGTWDRNDLSYQRPLQTTI
jgi:hypothetical protein